MQPVTAGAHICSPRADARRKGVGRPGKDGAAEAPPPPGSRVRRGHSMGRAVRAPRAGLALGARVSLATALQSPGRRRVIDGPPGDRRQVPATSRVGRVPESEAWGRPAAAPFLSLLHCLSHRPSVSGSKPNAGDPAVRPGVGVWGRTEVRPRTNGPQEQCAQQPFGSPWAAPKARAPPPPPPPQGCAA